MASVADTAYPAQAAEEFASIAAECRSCYQCGTCTSNCPSAAELDSGPRRLVRLITAGDMAAVLGSDDLWRCTECGGCTTVCRMDIDVAALLQRLRRLERATRADGQAGASGASSRCPERTAADVATAQLRRRPRIENARFGVAMASRGHVPKDKVGAAGMGVKMARQKLRAARVHGAGAGGRIRSGRRPDCADRPRRRHDRHPALLRRLRPAAGPRAVHPGARRGRGLRRTPR